MLIAIPVMLAIVLLANPFNLGDRVIQSCVRTATPIRTRTAP